MWKLVAVVGAVALLAGGAAQGARKVAPSNTSPPTISGTAHEGDTLTAGSGSWSGTAPINFAYRWQRCDAAGGNCVDVRRGSAYRVAAADAGATLRFVVVASNEAGQQTAISPPTAVVS